MPDPTQKELDHISDDDLMLYALGMVKNETELARLEDCLLVVPCLPGTPRTARRADWRPPEARPSRSAKLTGPHGGIPCRFEVSSRGNVFT